MDSSTIYGQWTQWMVFEFSIGSVEYIFYLQFWDSERGNALWILHYGNNCLMLETLFEFVFSKMTSAKFKPCNEFKPSDILRAGSKLFQSMAVGRKSQFFKKMKFVLIRGCPCFLSSIDVFF